MSELKLRPPRENPESGPPQKDGPYTRKRKARTDLKVGHYKTRRKTAGLEDSPCATRAGLKSGASIRKRNAPASEGGRYKGGESG
jgi:hypothetical protein